MRIDDLSAGDGLNMAIRQRALVGNFLAVYVHIHSSRGQRI